MRMVRRWGDRQDSANRLDPIRFPLIVDKGDHGLGRRSSSAIAKYADALRRISLACRSSRFSRSSLFSFSATSAGTPARVPLSTSFFLTHSLSVCAVQPILPATELTAAHLDGCSFSCSSTNRIARSRTSGEKLVFVFFSTLIAPPSQDLEPPSFPGRFSLFGQFLHLVGHHGEALARFPGTRGLDRRIERQKI